MKNYWDNSEYQQISSVVAEDNEVLNIGFKNGDAYLIPVQSVVPNWIKTIDLNALKFDSYSITIPHDEGTIEVPWDKIRVLTDSEFGKYLADAAADKAKTVGEKLKALRERKGIKSKDLAIRSGLTPQTISRIEKGHTDVSFSSLRKILASMGFTLTDLAEQEVHSQVFEKSLTGLLSKLNKISIDSNFVVNRIIPSSLKAKLEEYGNHPPSLLLDEVGTYISAIYGWNVKDIWGDKELRVDTNPAHLAFYKKSAKYSTEQIKAYSHYAYRIANIIEGSTTKTEVRNIPSNVEEFTLTLKQEYGELNMVNLLDYAWDLGIIVIPLSDSGVFHGASWNINGRKVVVLKQKVPSHARWIFDLLHEIYHAFVHLENENSAVIETDEINPFGDNDSEEEREANSFANKVIFQGRADEIAEECVSAAKWDVRNLKKTVPVISNKKKVGVDFLANYIAFRLAYQGTNWWGTAKTFQKEEPSAFEITRDKLISNLLFDKMTLVNKNLIDLALS